MPKCGEDASLGFDEAFMGEDFIGDGGSDGVLLTVFVDFGEEGAPLGLHLRVDGRCDKGRHGKDVGDNREMV